MAEGVFGLVVGHPTGMAVEARGLAQLVPGRMRSGWTSSRGRLRRTGTDILIEGRGIRNGGPPMNDALHTRTEGDGGSAQHALQLVALFVMVGWDGIVARGAVLAVTAEQAMVVTEAAVLEGRVSGTKVVSRRLCVVPRR